MPTTSPPMKPGSRKLSELAKHLATPKDITSTGWPAVRKTCVEKLGITFDDWQDATGRVILAKRADGNLAAMVDGVGMSLPRQVGKTYLVGATVFALCVNMPGLLVIWSAHHARTHAETFLAMQGFAERAKVKAHVKQIFTGSGTEEIRFHNGSRILFGARERGFGRGIPGVDILIFDEAQILSDKALANMLATMNTSRFGLQLYIGTPPKPDDMSESFTRMRKEALAKTLVDGAWIEFGADADAKHDDREQWRKANPSYPRRTPAQSLLRLKRKLAEADWLREGMGIWDEETPGAAIPYGHWLDLADAGAERGAAVAFGIDVTEDRSAWIATAWHRADAGVQVQIVNEPVEQPVPMPVHRMVAEVQRLAEEWSAQVVTPPAFFDELERAGVAVIKATSADFAVACGSLADAVTTGTLHHGNQAALNEAIKAARWRSAGTQSERAFQLKDCPEVGPAAAAVRALHGLGQGTPTIW